MKSFVLVAISVFSQIAFAQVEEVVVELPSPRYGTYVFQIQNADAGQAIAYIDESRLPMLFDRMAAQTGLLKTTIEKIYAEYECDPDGTVLGNDTFECGRLNPFQAANTVLWSYGRGGWASGGAAYRTHLTFTTAGTGHFTEMALIIESTIAVEAMNADDVYNGTALPVFEATYRFERAHLFDLNGKETILPLQ